MKGAGKILAGIFLLCVAFVCTPSHVFAMDEGFNFRATSGYVTDPADTQYVGATTAYPTTNGGVTFGWVTTTGLSSRDRSAAVDPRLAGLVFRTGGTSAYNDFEVDLDAAGTYDVSIALGDMSFTQTGNYAEIYDGSTLLWQVNAANLSQPAGQYFDANSVLHTTANFFSEETPVRLTFSTNQLIVRIGTVNSGAGNDIIAHLRVTSVASSGTESDISSAHFKILDPTIAPGGYGSSGSYKLYGSIGETAHGTSSSVSYALQLGFFSFPAADAPVASAQVGNASGRVDLSWSASIGHLGYSIAGYDVGVATASGGPYTYTSVGNVLTHNVTSLSNGVPYYFVVRGLDGNGAPLATSSEITATPVAASLTFLIDSGNQSINITPGNFVATSSILSLQGSNATGFSVTLARADSTATLTHSVDASTHIADKTDWVAPAATTTPSDATASTTDPYSLQFRLWKAQTDLSNYSNAWWGSDDTTLGALFAGIPSTTQTIFNRSVPAAATTTARVLYGLDVDQTQKTGTYTGDITYSATANP